MHGYVRWEPGEHCVLTRPEAKHGHMWDEANSNSGSLFSSSFKHQPPSQSSPLDISSPLSHPPSCISPLPNSLLPIGLWRPHGAERRCPCVGGTDSLKVLGEPPPCDLGMPPVRRVSWRRVFKKTDKQLLHKDNVAFLKNLVLLLSHWCTMLGIITAAALPVRYSVLERLHIALIKKIISHCVHWFPKSIPYIPFHFSLSQPFFLSLYCWWLFYFIMCVWMSGLFHWSKWISFCFLSCILWMRRSAKNPLF